MAIEFKRRIKPKAVVDFIPNATWEDIMKYPEIFRFLVKTGWIKNVNLEEIIKHKEK